MFTWRSYDTMTGRNISDDRRAGSGVGAMARIRSGFGRIQGYEEMQARHDRRRNLTAVGDF